MTAPRWRVGEQIQLAVSVADVHRRNGDWLRALLRQAVEANRLLVVDLAAECDVDEKQLGRALRDEGGANLPLQFLSCLLAHDKAGVIVRGLLEFLGWEGQPKKPDLAAENRQLRTALLAVRAEIDALLGGGQ